jgi:hypothetical protein
MGGVLSAAAMSEPTRAENLGARTGLMAVRVAGSLISHVMVMVWLFSNLIAVFRAVLISVFSRVIRPGCRSLSIR